jgi:hypothetical protein
MIPAMRGTRRQFLARAAAQFCILAAIVAPRLHAADQAPDRAALDFFEERIRPVLVESCHGCHSRAAGKQEGGLYLDSSEAIRRGGNGGPVLSPGSPDASRLLAALTHEQDELQMPPDGPLPEPQRADFRAWIAAGAAMPDDAPAATDRHERSQHWAFQPIVRPVVPQVQHADWCWTPIDRFVVRQLEEQSMEPALTAPREVLIRRMTFDLLGLAPTLDEVQAYANDASPDATERLVDRLLASPRYGERWGRHWLDVARYADTKDQVLAFGNDRIRPYSYTYRDYVVRSWNADLPFDRFVHEQLAADQLDPPTDRSKLAAMGFLTVGRLFDENAPDIIDDQLDVVGRGLMGLTISCARCHDHKYDPIPTADYYSLYGVFASTERPIPLPLLGDVPDTAEARDFEAKAAEVNGQLQQHIDREYRERMDEACQRTTDYLLRVATQPADPVETAVFYMSLTPGELRPVITGRWRRHVRLNSGVDDPVFGPWGQLAALPPDRFAAESRSTLAAWAARPAGEGSGQVNPLVRDALTAAPLDNLEAMARAYGSAFTAAFERYLAADRSLDALDAPSRQLVGLLVEPHGPVYFLRQHAYLYMSRVERDRYHNLLQQLDKMAVESPAAPPRAMALVDSPAPVDPRIFVRGNPQTLGRSVPRQLPTLLNDLRSGPFQQGSGRRELAQAITDPRNPLTSRVLANRLWMHHLGQPLVATPSDFGLRGATPTHPELLDYLAWTLLHDDQWSIKKFHRRLMLSHVYQQSSDDRAEYRAIDPANQFYWRMARRRLDLESMRDTMLQVAGRLDGRLGGRPEPLTADPLHRRRTLYGLVDRQELPGLYRSFDFASPDQSAAQRPRTTTPQQALFAMNSPFVIAQAAALADGLPAEANDRERLRWLYGRVLGREPIEAEQQTALEFLKASSAAASEAAETVTAPQSTWTQLAQVLLASNEFFYVD